MAGREGRVVVKVGWFEVGGLMVGRGKGGIMYRHIYLYVFIVPYTFTTH